MPTLRDTAALLAAADSPDGLTAIATQLGFTDAPQPLDHLARTRLGLPGELHDASLIRGTGALRALLVRAPATTALRLQLGSIAAALARTTGQVLWIVVASAGDETGIACWTGDRLPPRVLALVANRRRIVSSDADALRALAGAADAGDDLHVHMRWCELLGREALTRRFYRTLEQRVAGLAASLPGIASADAAELALLTVSRLVFLCFLQAKGWLDGERDFLSARFDDCMRASGGFHRRVLLPLFFGTLNTPYRQRAPRARAFGQVPFLNGGLFARTPLERRHPRAYFTDDAIGQLFAQLLDAYRFTAREDDDAWSEVAVDPEMLGRAFESLMASRERRTSGAFYTPQPLVAHVADAALVNALARDSLGADMIRDAMSGARIPFEAASALRERLRRFTVLDPACGSGAFLVHLLERLTALHLAAGDQRPVATVRREVLARAIHGVDVNPTAVWLCELRLWLCVVIESDETRMRAVTPLPNLDCNVRIGDTLSGETFAVAQTFTGPPAALLRLRERYARAAGAAKAPLRRALLREERQRALAVIDRSLDALSGHRRERVLARRAPDLFGIRTAEDAAERRESQRLRARAAAMRRERRRIASGGALPFSFPSHFGHVHASGGFDLVVGNPPWVRVHNIPVATRALLRQRFVVCRDAGWRPAFADTPAVQSFGSQVDLAALFVERSLALARHGGTVALLVPSKLWSSLSGGGVRRLLGTDARLQRLEDYTAAPSVFDAAVYPSLFLATREPPNFGAITIAVRRGSLAMEWASAAGAHQVDPDVASPWLFLPPVVRAAWNVLTAAGPPLGGSLLGRATLGVKCGCNDAFMVEAGEGEGEQVHVEHRGRHGSVERALLRPLLRAEALTPWVVAPSRRAILWTHGPNGDPLRALPAGAARWLAPWRQRLAARSDLRGSRQWWTLFRTDAADSARPRVVWGDFGRVPRAALLPAGAATVPLNSCYILPCDDVRDALALTALFNSRLAAAWLNVLAEPARGGWHRYLAWTVSLLPLPRDWHRAREILAPLAERAMLGTPPTGDELLEAACLAYGVAVANVEPLLAWMS